MPTIRDLAQQTFAPDRYRQLGASRRALATVDLAGQEAFKRFTKVQSRRNGKRADAKKAISEIGARL